MTPEETLVFLPWDQRFAVGERKPGEEVTLIENSWWVTHPERGLAFARDAAGRSSRFCHPQCNVNEAITRKLQVRLYPNLQVNFEPLVYVRRKLSGAYPIPTSQQGAVK